MERAIAGAASNVDRLATLIDSYDSFSHKHREQLEAALQNAIQAAPSSDVQPIWDALRNFVGHHRQFPEAAWSLDDESLKRLEQLAYAAEPRDLLVRHRWLFSDHMPPLPIARADDDYARELENHRIAAIRELWSGGQGIDQVLQFIRESQYPGRIAEPLAKLELPMAALADLFMRTVNGSRAEGIFAMSISGALAVIAQRRARGRQSLVDTTDDSHCLGCVRRNRSRGERVPVSHCAWTRKGRRRSAAANSIMHCVLFTSLGSTSEWQRIATFRQAS